MTADAPLSLRQAHTEQVLTLFSDPPTLDAVAQDIAQAWLDLYAAQHRYHAGLIYLGFPASETAPTTYRYKSLPQLLLERLAAAQPTLLTADYHVVAQRARETYTVGGPPCDRGAADQPVRCTVARQLRPALASLVA